MEMGVSLRRGNNKQTFLLVSKLIIRLRGMQPTNKITNLMHIAADWRVPV